MLGRLNYKPINKLVATLMTKPVLRPIAIAAVAVVGAFALTAKRSEARSSFTALKEV